MKYTKNYLSTLLALSFIAMYFIACEDFKPKPVNTEVPDQIISIVKAKEMYDSYTDRRENIIKEFEAQQSNDSMFSPTRFGWYDYKTIKQYIAFIEKEAKEAGVEISGLQFYLTNYPDKEVFADGSKVKYPKQNSFFIIPTINRGGKDYGFYTWENEKGRREALLIKSRDQQFLKLFGHIGLNNNMVAMPNAMNSEQISSDSIETNNDSIPGEQSLILNESNLVPPPNQGTDFD